MVLCGISGMVAVLRAIKEVRPSIELTHMQTYVCILFLATPIALIICSVTP